MAFSSLSDPHLVLAAWAALLSALLAGLLAILILALRASTRRAEADWRDFVRDWRPLLLAAVATDAGAPAIELPRLRRRQQQFFLRLWLYLHESLRGEAAQRLNEAALAVEAPRWSLRLLVRGSATDRILAALALGRLQWRPAWAQLLRAAHSRDPLLSVNAARALVQIDPLEAPRELLPLLLGRTDWDVSRVGDFLGGARQPFWLQLVRAMPRAPAAHVVRGLQLARALRLELPDTALAALLAPGQPARVVAAVLPLAGRASMRQAVKAALEHDDWRVREAATLAMTGIAREVDVPALAGRLEDHRFEVRLAAARGLASLPFVHPADLARLQAQCPGGEPVLRQVIAEQAA